MLKYFFTAFSLASVKGLKAIKWKIQNKKQKKKKRIYTQNV